MPKRYPCSDRVLQLSDLLASSSAWARKGDSISGIYNQLPEKKNGLVFKKPGFIPFSYISWIITMRLKAMIFANNSFTMLVLHYGSLGFWIVRVFKSSKSTVFASPKKCFTDQMLTFDRSKRLYVQVLYLRAERDLRAKPLSFLLKISRKLSGEALYPLLGAIKP